MNGELERLQNLLESTATRFVAAVGASRSSNPKRYVESKQQLSLAMPHLKALLTLKPHNVRYERKLVAHAFSKSNMSLSVDRLSTSDLEALLS